MTQERRGQIVESLKDKELRDYYVADHISEGLAFQIRAMREARGWTQRELGERAGGMAQERISQLEDPNYGRLSLSTLKRIASAFDVALIVRFAPYSELIDWTLGLSPDQMEVPCFDADPGLKAASPASEPSDAPPFSQDLTA